MTAPSQKALEARHPIYSANHVLWEYYAAHYDGGVLYPTKINPLPNIDAPGGTPKSVSLGAQAGGFFGVSRYLWQYPLEATDKFRHRLARAVYINIVAPVVDFYAATVGKAENVLCDPDPALEVFEDDIDLQGQSYLQFMAAVRTNAAVRGHSFVLVDSTRATDVIVTQRDAENQKIRPYCREILPEDMLNFRVDAVGAPAEILFRVKLDPPGSLLDEEAANAGSPNEWEYRYWTPTEWRVYEKVKDVIVLKDAGAHNLGKVPLVTLFHRRIRAMLGESLLKDSAKIAQLATNWVSGLDEAMEAQMFAIPCWTSKTSPTEAGVGSAIVMHLNPDQGEDFKYVAPDTAPFEAGWDAFYRMIQLANKFMGVAPKAIDTTSSKDPQSGISKEWDFVETEKILARMALNEQEAAEAIFHLAAAWQGHEWTGGIQYATKYDLSTAQDDINDLIALQSAGLPPTARQEMMRRIVAKKMPSLPEKKADEINKEIDGMGEYVDPAVEAAGIAADQKMQSLQAKPMGKPTDKAGRPTVAASGPKPATPPAA